MQVREVMERGIEMVRASDSIEYAESLLQRGHELLVVVDESGRPVGVLHQGQINPRMTSASSNLERGLENEVDEALDETFPASDPISPA
ncbi:CBS domain-containing protein [Marinobacter salicampi]|uniref:CBS domain-containing protein n=1 Tax=Marinobacter salicampi TaxID=435907 RepID=UPI00140BC71C|nr:CBS domain-containing protein [Marinobacter salicampi]